MHIKIFDSSHEDVVAEFVGDFRPSDFVKGEKLNILKMSGSRQETAVYEVQGIEHVVNTNPDAEDRYTFTVIARFIPQRL
jgi:hypothetical protein